MLKRFVSVSVLGITFVLSRNIEELKKILKLKLWRMGLSSRVAGSMKVASRLLNI